MRQSDHVGALSLATAPGGMRGQPLRRPRRVYADSGYDHERYRDQVRRLEINPVIARRGTEHGSGLGVHRPVAAGAFALPHWFRRLRIRWEIRDDIHQAFVTPRRRHHLLATPQIAVTWPIIR
jgi:hypothetical protein